jgi:hypothetical protein
MKIQFENTYSSNVIRDESIILMLSKYTGRLVKSSRSMSRVGWNCRRFRDHLSPSQGFHDDRDGFWIVGQFFLPVDTADRSKTFYRR